MRKDITNLQATAQETSEFVATATPQLGSIREFDDRLLKLDGSLNQTQGLFQTLKTDQEGLRQVVATEREFTRGLPTRQQFTNEIASSRQQVTNEFRQTIEKELDSIRTLANTSMQTANSNKEAIGALARRISAVEADLKKLQGRVTTFEEAKAQRIQ